MGGLISEIPLALLCCDPITRKGLHCRIQSLQFGTTEQISVHIWIPSFHFASPLKRKCLPKSSKKQSNASSQFHKSASSTRIHLNQRSPQQTLRGGEMYHQSPQCHSHRGSQARAGTYSMALGSGVKGWKPHPHFHVDKGSLVSNRAGSVQHSQCYPPTRGPSPTTY